MAKMKKTLAAVLACTMAFSAGMTAFAADTVADKDGTSDVTVDSEAGVKTPIISVSVPASMDTFVNPFGIGEANGISSQITTAEQLIINKSSVAVKVSIKGSVEGATGVSVKPKATDVTIDDAGNDAKELYVEAVALPGTWATTGGSATAIKPEFTIASDVTYAAATGASVASKKAIPAGTTAMEEIMTFALKKAADSVNTDFTTADSVDTTNGVAAWRLMGTVNPAAQWVGTAGSEDVKIHLVYSISGLPDQMYTDLYNNSADYNPSGKVTNMVNTHIEKIQVKNADGDAIHDITFTQTDGAYTAPAGLTLTSLKSNITIESIAGVEIIDGNGTVPANNGMTYIKATKALNVMPTWVTLATAPLKDQSEVKVKITFNITDTKNPVAEGDPSLTEYIIVTLKKA